MIIIKFAQNLLGFIGKDNIIPWKCKDDLQESKQATTDNIVIMGRKTFANKNVYIIGGAMLIESAIRLLGNRIARIEVSVIKDTSIGDVMVDQRLVFSSNIPISVQFYSNEGK